jgi:hypothetical protein
MGCCPDSFTDSFDSKRGGKHPSARRLDKKARYQFYGTRRSLGSDPRRSGAGLTLNPTKFKITHIAQHPSKNERVRTGPRIHSSQLKLTMPKIKRGRNLGQRLKIRRRSRLNEDDDDDGEQVIPNPHSSTTGSPRINKNASATSNVEEDVDVSASSAPFQRQQDAASPHEEEKEEEEVSNVSNKKRGKKRLSRKEQKDRKKQRRPASVAADRDQDCSSESSS